MQVAAGLIQAIACSLPELAPSDDEAMLAWSSIPGRSAKAPYLRTGWSTGKARACSTLQELVELAVDLWLALDVGLCNEDAVTHHMPDIAEGSEVVEGVGVGHDHVCVLAGLERAGHIVDACYLRVAERGAIEGK